MGFMQWHAWRAGVVCAVMSLSACGAGLAPDTAKEAPAAAKAAAPFTGNGIWWNPSEPGTGLFFEAQGNVGVITFYAFEATGGRSVWYSASGSFVAVDDAYEFKGTLQRYSNGQSRYSATPRTPASAAAGDVRVVFRGDGASVSVPGRDYAVVKFNPSGQAAQALPSHPETGIYWNPAEPGRGYAIEFHNGVLTMGLFYYDDAGQPTWNLVATELKRNDLLADIKGYRNGQSLSGAYRQPVGGSDGIIRGLFFDPCAADIWLPTMGKPTPIQRFSFGSLPAQQECPARTARSQQDGAAQGFARALVQGEYAFTRLATDGSGTLYGIQGNQIKRIRPGAQPEVLAGSAQSWGYADGQGEAALFNKPAGLAADAAGNVYVADSVHRLIRKISPSGAVTTVVGNREVFGWRDGDARTAVFGSPGDMTMDLSGNLYVVDDRSVRRVAPDGSVLTVLGSGPIMPAITEGNLHQFARIDGVAVDTAGHLYVAESSEDVRGVLRRFDRNGRAVAYPATATGALPICEAMAMAADASQNVYVVCRPLLLAFRWSVILKVTAGGRVTRYAGSLDGVGVQYGSDQLQVVGRPATVAIDMRNPAAPLFATDSRSVLEVTPMPNAAR